MNARHRNVAAQILTIMRIMRARVWQAAKAQETVNGPIYLGWGTDLFSPSEKETRATAWRLPFRRTVADTRSKRAFPKIELTSLQRGSIMNAGKLR